MAVLSVYAKNGNDFYQALTTADSAVHLHPPLHSEYLPNEQEFKQTGIEFQCFTAYGTD